MRSCAKGAACGENLGRIAYSALAAEVAYDRALIALCTERGIDAHATSFAYPGVERRRIEMLLALDGVDLDAPPLRLAGTEPERFHVRSTMMLGVWPRAPSLSPTGSAALNPNFEERLKLPPRRARCPQPNRHTTGDGSTRRFLPTVLET